MNLQIIKLKIKRIIIFLRNGGAKYLSLRGFINALWWRICNGINIGHKKLIWLGPFSPIHANVGDHLQTLAVYKYLNNEFSDYKIKRIYRDNIRDKSLKRLIARLTGNDIVLIHSSGDFGSLHDVPGHQPGSLSFPEIRRRLVSGAPSKCRIINLPVTAYYEDTAKGRESLRKDKAIFDESNLTILCREEYSLQVVKKNLLCSSFFFPDFVFYLKPHLLKIDRKGVLVILRNDKESIITVDQRNILRNILKTSFAVITEKDIMHAAHTIPDFIMEKYMTDLFEQYQHYELVVTDKMHGMITAVITNTPCIALTGGIPHKIKAYKSFLSDAVIFIDEIRDISEAISQIKQKDYRSVDLSEYFWKFRKEIVGV